MNHLENYYRNLCEQLQAQVELLEKKIQEKKKGKKVSKGTDKKADKDYDGDGEVESPKEEYFGSKDKAIKKNMAKKKGLVDKKKKKKLEEGRVIGNGEFLYGGFPRILNEVEIRLAEGNANPDEAPDTHATDAFNDGDDGPGEGAVATKSDQAEASEEEMVAQINAMQDQYDTSNIDFSEPGEFNWGHSTRGRELRSKINALQDALYKRKQGKKD